MKNKHLDTIKKSIIQQFNMAYGYCGVMDGDNIAVLNSGKGKDNFVIKIMDQSAIDQSKSEQTT